MQLTETITHYEGRIMKRVFALLVASVLLLSVGAVAQNKYVGTKVCAPCHKTEKSGNQFAVWQKSPHASAFATLSTPKAAEVAKAKGLKTAAAESPECLQCHALKADAADPKDGVQCENCHGAGSSYKAMATMKDHAKAVAAGLTDFKDAAAKEKLCVTCHNEKSPTYKKFDFKTSWAKIAHMRPKKS